MDLPSLTLSGLTLFGAYSATKLLLTRRPVGSAPLPTPLILPDNLRHPIHVDPPVLTTHRDDRPSRPTLAAARQKVTAMNNEAAARHTAARELVQTF
jgi:hypothetical protein